MAAKKTAAATPDDDGKCKNCGACKECGAGGHPTYIPYPVYPYAQPYRPYMPYIQPTWPNSNQGTSAHGAFTYTQMTAGGNVQ